MFRPYRSILVGFRRGVAWCIALSVASGLAEALGIASVLPLLSGALRERDGGGGEYFGLRGDTLVGAALAALVALGLLSALLRYLAQIAVIRLQADVEESLRSRMTSALLNMAWPQFLHLSLGETGKSVLIEATQVAVGVQYIVNGVGYAAVAAVFIVVAAVVSPVMTAATLAFGAAMAGVYRLTGKRAGTSSRRLSGEATDLVESTTDLLANAKFYRSTGARQVAVAGANSSFAEWKRLYVRVQRYSPVTRLVFDTAGLVFIAVVFGVTLLLADGSPIEALVFLALFYRLAPKLQQAQQGLFGARVQASWAETWERRYLGAVRDAELQSGSVVLTHPPKVAFDRVSYSFPGQDAAVLDEVSWTLEPGECVAIVGESGSGKTTALDLVTGLLRPTSGAVRLDGTDLVDVDTEAWRARLGFVIQDAPMFFGTVLDNITWGDPDPDRDRATHVANLAHLGDVIAGLPDGLDTSIGLRGARLSGGQRQRIALARALYREPWLLVLDEATSALDSDSEREVQAALRSLKGEVSILLVAHRLATVEVADRIVVMSKGRVVQSGPWDELTTIDGEFRRMAAMQGLARAVSEPPRAKP